MLGRKIGFKLTVAVGVTALVTISVFAYISSRSYSKSLLAEVERHANQLSETVRSSTEYDMLLNQRERIHESITRMGSQRSIERIRVMNKTGSIIYSSDGEEIGRMVDMAGESCYMCHSAGRPLERLEMQARTRVFRLKPDAPRTLGIINPIYNAPSCWTAACHAHPQEQVVLGVLDVTLPLAEVDKDIRAARIEIVIFAVSAIFALSLIIGVFVKRWVDVPVEELLRATQRIGDGDFNYRIPENKDDELGLLAKTFNTMTQRLSEARLQLFQSDKMASLGRLAAGIAHEINNPLTGVLTYSSFLLKRTNDQPELQEDLKVIVRETIRSREIVKSLLDFARQSVPKKAEADINEVIARAAVVVENQFTLNNVKLVQELDPALPRAVVDANQMQQVFINLFVNAADAIGAKGGTIHVSTSSMSLSPVGITQIKKALCPKRHNLVDHEVRIDGKPSIRIKARSNGNEGFVYLNSIYGAGGHHHGIVLDANTEVQLVCPECAVSLRCPGLTCPDCGSAVYTFEVPPRGMVEGCARKGCDWQRWEAVETSGQREYIEARVRDDGCGIAEDQLAKIFEPFYSTKGQKGNGLGLAVIWGIIDNHNGTISVESEVGVGATFIIRIPVRA